MRVLSLFDGMSCGMLAFQKCGIKIDEYVAYEIDKYAVKTSKHNFQNIKHMGDVFEADFSNYYGFDFIVGGALVHIGVLLSQKIKEKLLLLDLDGIYFLSMLEH